MFNIVWLFSQLSEKFLWEKTDLLPLDYGCGKSAEVKKSKFSHHFIEIKVYMEKYLI